MHKEGGGSPAWLSWEIKPGDLRPKGAVKRAPVSWLAAAPVLVLSSESGTVRPLYEGTPFYCDLEEIAAEMGAGGGVHGDEFLSI